MPVPYGSLQPLALLLGAGTFVAPDIARSGYQAAFPAHELDDGSGPAASGFSPEENREYTFSRPYPPRGGARLIDAYKDANVLQARAGRPLTPLQKAGVLKKERAERRAEKFRQGREQKREQKREQEEREQKRAQERRAAAGSLAGLGGLGAGLLSRFRRRKETAKQPTVAEDDEASTATEQTPSSSSGTARERSVSPAASSREGKGARGVVSSLKVKEDQSVPKGKGKGEVPPPPKGKGKGEIPPPPKGKGKGEIPAPPKGKGKGEIPAPPKGKGKNGKSKEVVVSPVAAEIVTPPHPTGPLALRCDLVSCARAVVDSLKAEIGMDAALAQATQSCQIQKWNTRFLLQSAAALRKLELFCGKVAHFLARVIHDAAVRYVFMKPKNPASWGELIDGLFSSEKSSLRFLRADSTIKIPGVSLDPERSLAELESPTPGLSKQQRAELGLVGAPSFPGLKATARDTLKVVGPALFRILASLPGVPLHFEDPEVKARHSEEDNLFLRQSNLKKIPSILSIEGALHKAIRDTGEATARKAQNLREQSQKMKMSTGNRSKKDGSAEEMSQIEARILQLCGIRPTFKKTLSPPESAKAVSALHRTATLSVMDCLEEATRALERCALSSSKTGASASPTFRAAVLSVARDMLEYIHHRKRDSSHHSRTSSPRKIGAASPDWCLGAPISLLEVAALDRKIKIPEQRTLDLLGVRDISTRGALVALFRTAVDFAALLEETRDDKAPQPSPISAHELTEALRGLLALSELITVTSVTDGAFRLC